MASPSVPINRLCWLTIPESIASAVLVVGPKQGQSDIFIDNLPGFPDGIMWNGKDIFWLAMVNRRDPGLDFLLPRPFLRKIVWRLPYFLQPNIKRYAFVLGLDMNGKVVRNLQDPSAQSSRRSRMWSNTKANCTSAVSAKARLGD